MRTKMKITKTAKFIIVGVLIIVAALAVYFWPKNKKNEDSEKQAIEAKTAEIQNYVKTTQTRVNKALVTVPPDNGLIGMRDGKGTLVNDEQHPTPVTVALEN